jgi:tRNA(fMet)-specific endonuclease VapC
LEVRLLVDTNLYTDFARGVPEVVDRFETADLVVISVVVLGELRSGFAVGSQRASNEKILDQFLDRANVVTQELDAGSSQFYATVFSELRRLGRPIPTNDMWLAAQALQHELVLDSRDEHFRHVPGLILA